MSYIIEVNYLAHLFLAQPTADSYFGNLLGDFRRGVAVDDYPPSVLAGLQTHYMVDKYTDSHPLVRNAKRRFSPHRRRFAGIALDVAFDHFLIKHWEQYAQQNFNEFCDSAYGLLAERLNIMPPRMQQVVGSMITDRWLNQYQALEGVGYALDNITNRIRFTNRFVGSVEELRLHYHELDACFREFFPQLIYHVEEHGPERRLGPAIAPDTSLS